MALHALRLSASADDGKRLGAQRKALRVAFHSTKWILEGGCGGEDGEITFFAVRASRDLFFMLGRLERPRAPKSDPRAAKSGQRAAKSDPRAAQERPRAP